MSLQTPIPNADADLLQRDPDRKPTAKIAWQWYRFLAALAAPSDGPKTVVLAKITPAGSDGSITYNAQGLVISSVDPT